MPHTFSKIQIMVYGPEYALGNTNKGCNFLPWCADVGYKVLNLCQHNIERNLPELDSTGNVIVRELDWTEPCFTSGKFSSLSTYYVCQLQIWL